MISLVSSRPLSLTYILYYFVIERVEGISLWPDSMDLIDYSEFTLWYGDGIICCFYHEIVVIVAV